MSWITVPGWFSQEEGIEWQKHCKGKKVLELGRHKGRSCACAAEVAWHVISIDRISDTEPLQHLTRLNLQNKVTLLTGEFSDKIIGLEKWHKFGTVLLDGGHTPFDIGWDVRLIKLVIYPGTIVAFHDYDNLPTYPDVRPAVQALISYLNWKPISIVGSLAVYQVQ